MKKLLASVSIGAGILLAGWLAVLASAAAPASAHTHPVSAACDVLATNSSLASTGPAHNDGPRAGTPGSAGSGCTDAGVTDARFTDPGANSQHDATHDADAPVSIGLSTIALLMGGAVFAFAGVAARRAVART